MSQKIMKTCLLTKCKYDYISKGPGSKGPGSKRPLQRVPKKRVPQQLWHIFSLSRTIFKASRRGHFECTQVQNVHKSRYSYGGMGPYEMYTNRAVKNIQRHLLKMVPVRGAIIKKITRRTTGAKGNNLLQAITSFK